MSQIAPKTGEPVEIQARKMSQTRARRILARQGGHCAACGKLMGEFHIDHIIPIALGGADDDGNVEAICATPCHAIKTKADVKAIAKAKRLERGPQPSKRPMKSQGFDKTRSRGFDGKVRAK